ncbi:MAG: 2-hydroxyglutaryl-CoA dehydratase [Chloroflexi bacterium]|nr:2-hydroxyglutaryl-CoA dehydratase [Chloroflexota bacterium]
MKPVGITTTVPIEILQAAGHTAVDLNNVFVTDPNPERLVGLAERSGFPLNCCTWIKGIYGVCLDRKIDTVLCVTTGDCSNTIMLMEVLRLKGVRVIPFAYPDQPDVGRMQECLESLAGQLGTTVAAAEAVRNDLAPCRELAGQLDELTWKEDLVSGWENHLWLVSSSDFNGNPQQYQRDLEQLLSQCRQRPTPGGRLRLAYIGVPPVFARDLYRFLEWQGAAVVFNEVQRQFAMPRPGHSLAEQYSHYTYPYSIFNRLEDISAEIRRRRVDGVIHYVQAFCHRAIGDIIFRSMIKTPILTIEGNADYVLTPHLQTKLEAFIDMLNRSRQPLQDGT